MKNSASLSRSRQDLKTCTIWCYMTDSASRAILVAIAGPATGDTFRIDELEAVVGREEGNSVALPDPSVSRRHCALRRTDSGWTVHDLGSFNGTFLNGEPVREAALQDGDRVRAGETEFLFRCQTSRVQAGAVESLRATTRFEVHASRYLQLATLGQPDPRTQRDLQSLVRLGHSPQRPPRPGSSRDGASPHRVQRRSGDRCGDSARDAGLERLPVCRRARARRAGFPSAPSDCHRSRDCPQRSRSDETCIPA